MDPLCFIFFYFPPNVIIILNDTFKLEHSNTRVFLSFLPNSDLDGNFGYLAGILTRPMKKMGLAATRRYFLFLSPHMPACFPVVSALLLRSGGIWEGALKSQAILNKKVTLALLPVVI